MNENGALFYLIINDSRMGLKLIPFPTAQLLPQNCFSFPQDDFRDISKLLDDIKKFYDISKSLSCLQIFG